MLIVSYVCHSHFKICNSLSYSEQNFIQVNYQLLLIQTFPTLKVISRPVFELNISTTFHLYFHHCSSFLNLLATRVFSYHCCQICHMVEPFFARTETTQNYKVNRLAIYGFCHIHPYNIFFLMPILAKTHYTPLLLYAEPCQCSNSGVRHVGVTVSSQAT